MKALASVACEHSGPGVRDQAAAPVVHRLCFGLRTLRERTVRPQATGGADVLHLWNAEQQAVESGVEIGEYRGVVRVPRRVFQRLLPERPTPERCVEAYYLQRTRFKSITERKLRRRQLSEDGNVEITGRDLR
jgi:hypothetical protein